MIRKYKILLKPNDLVSEDIENNLIDTNGYLTHQATPVAFNAIVTPNVVKDYMSNPRNANVVSGFTKYLKDNTTDPEYKNIYYDSNKLSPLVNDYYDRKVRLNISPRIYLIQDVLSGSTSISHKDMNFDLNGNRNLDDKFTLIQTASTESFYLPVFIERRGNEVHSTDFSKYFADCVENGIVLKNCFVNLNKKDDPFEYWNNDNRRFNIKSFVINKL